MTELTPKMEQYIRRMPKVELHVHLEGSIQPETLLVLAERNKASLPTDNLEGLRAWFQFKDFPHFIEVYLAICGCVRTAEDFEQITRDFLIGQARQNIRYSEVIYTPYSHKEYISLADQWVAIQRARAWAEKELGVTMNLAPDISRQVRPIEHSLEVAQFAIEHMHDGIVALGLGGPEVNNPPELFAETFDIAHEAGLPSAPHAGETEGPASVWGALRALHAVRIGHGVRSLEDPALIAYLKEKQIPLDVCPSSNVCLGVAPSLEEHPLPRLLDAGLLVTLNSDDPPLFSTTLTDEYLRVHRTFGFDRARLQSLALNGIRASLLDAQKKASLEAEFRSEFKALENELGLAN